MISLQQTIEATARQAPGMHAGQTIRGADTYTLEERIEGRNPIYRARAQESGETVVVKDTSPQMDFAVRAASQDASAMPASCRSSTRSRTSPARTRSFLTFRATTFIPSSHAKGR